MKTNKILISLLALLVVCFGVVKITKGAGASEIIVTWKTDTYAPAWFLGKILPTRNSNISAAVSVVDNGVLADLSEFEIRWDGGGEVFQSGIGLDSFNFKVPKFSSGEQSLTVSIVGYNGSNIRKTVFIPIVNPEIIIDTNLTDELVKSGGTVNIRALPFFFNVKNDSEIDLSWQINGERLQNQSVKNAIQLKIPELKSDSLIVKASASNKSDDFEFTGTQKYFNLVQ